MQQQQDNNSTTDISSISSGVDQANESSDNFLKVDAGGITGFFERIPLWLKLLFITALATFIMLVFAVWLTIVRGTMSLAVHSDRKLAKLFLFAVNLADSVQLERNTAVFFLIKPTNPDLLALQAQYPDVDARWTALVENSGPEAGSLISKRIGFLRQIRNGVEKQLVDTLYVYQWYTDTIAIIKEFISQNSKLYENHDALSAHFIFLELRIVIGQLLSYGTMAFANTNSSMTPSFYNTFKSLTVTRSALIDIWTHLASIDQVAKFNKTVLLDSKNTAAMLMENTALTANSSAFSFSINFEAWSGNMTGVSQAYSDILTGLLERVDSETYMQLLQSDLQFTVIGALAVIFIVLYASISYCFSRTIIGPWVRMNKLQESVTYKFVPRGLLRMIGCDNIMQVQVGKHSTRQIILMKIIIIDYWQHVESLSVENRILYTNRFFDAINPILGSYGGYIDTMKPDELQVCFKTPGSAITCANKIHHLIKSMNMSDFAPLNLTIAIHAASTVDLAIIGDQDRIQGVVISKLQRDARQIMYLAKKFQCKTVISNNVMEMLKEKIDNAQLIAMIDGKPPFVLYEISSKMNKSEMGEFSKAVRSVFVDHNIIDALAYFRTNENGAAKFYTKVCEQILEQCKSQIANLTVEDILNEPGLEDIVSYTCQKEQSTENLEIYKAIKLFKEACISSNRDTQRGCVLSIKNRMEQVNITDTLKQFLLSQVIEEELWSENMFQPLECEIILLLTDTTKRLKMSEPFRRAYIKCKGVKSDLLHERFGDS